MRNETAISRYCFQTLANKLNLNRREREKERGEEENAGRERYLLGQARTTSQHEGAEIGTTVCDRFEKHIVNGPPAAADI